MATGNVTVLLRKTPVGVFCSREDAEEYAKLKDGDFDFADVPLVPEQKKEIPISETKGDKDVMYEQTKETIHLVIRGCLILAAFRDKDKAKQHVADINHLLDGYCTLAKMVSVEVEG